MSKQISTSIEINASTEKVWEVLTEFEKYHEWNPFIKSITGEVKAGNKIKVELQGMTFKPTILKITKNSELRWLGVLGFKGIFDGEHRFHLSDTGNGTTFFEQSELFKGILIPIFSKSLDRDTRKGFEEMNVQLKKRVENFQEI